ncbi:hypothetical protein MLD38_029285 [Melastoma candidum]|uniref:Uncharacterized protein n=1 Tax=Melastoma candidum TaxID=119954 RepID=A0ACB9N3A9_9MYRT|nr:hypothetical protein MLD38_029285 [Melastoma candidum]
MVKAGAIFVCILILALDIGAGILGLEAEVQENKVKHLRMWVFECRQPSQGAFKLGLGAGFLLCAAHVLANLLGGCYNCVCTQEELQKASANRQLTMACLIFTWVILAVGLSMIVIGTLSNHKSKASCGFSHHHFMSIGGILCFVHGLFSVAYYDRHASPEFGRRVPPKTAIPVQSAEYVEMRRGGIPGDLYTCGMTRGLREGRMVDGEVVKRGYVGDSCVVNGLVGMYGKCEGMGCRKEGGVR